MSEATGLDKNEGVAPGEQSADALLATLGKTESKTPGRMRVRLHPEMRTPKAMAQVKASLEDHPDIQGVQINERTGSVVIKHHTRHDSHKLFWEAVKEVEMLAEVALEIPDEDDGGESPDAKLDEQLAELVYGIDKRIYGLTGHQLHLGLLIPASLAGIGIAQMLLYGVGLEMLPGPVLVWIAYDVYRRSGQEPPFVTHERDAVAVEEPEAASAEAAEAAPEQVVLATA